jgi:hypothetical protein
MSIAAARISLIFTVAILGCWTRGDDTRWSTGYETDDQDGPQRVVEHTGACYRPVEDLERMDRTEAERGRDLAILDAGQAAFKDVPAEEVEHEVAKAVAEVRLF